MHSLKLFPFFLLVLFLFSCGDIGYQEDQYAPQSTLNKTAKLDEMETDDYLQPNFNTEEYDRITDNPYL
ncbi:MAG: hypothetical protein JXA99_17280, partial [Candidatus Lokiarchaeota archaeon]|nr:hypothetical protein [Candidatus Lokiarchaeota archaeon]